MQNQSPPNQEHSLQQKIQFVKWLTQLAKLPLTILLRRNNGYDVLNPIHIVAVCGVMFLIAAMASPESRPPDLQVFAVLVLLIGLLQRQTRWLEFKRGIPHDAQNAGNSPFHILQLSPFIRDERRLERWADPVFCCVIGMAVFQVSHALGLVVVGCSVCLRINEFFIYRLWVQDRMRIGTDMAVAKAQEQTIDNFAHASDQGSQPRQASRGLPTGLASDLKRKATLNIAIPTLANAEVAGKNFTRGLLKPKLSRASIVLAFGIGGIADGLHFAIHLLGWGSGSLLGSLIMPQSASLTNLVGIAVDVIAMAMVIGLIGFNPVLLGSLVPFVPGIPRLPIPSLTLCVAWTLWKRRKEPAPADVAPADHTEITKEPEPASRLVRLAELHRQGLITDEEFQSKRQSMLQEL